MTARVLMIQGTSSSVGKSLLVAGLCRLFARRGVRVAPFKAQNMSNNAAVCADGAEIGRAQALQAAAAGIPPSAEMNPILLKPEPGYRSQVVILGRVWQTLPVCGYQERKAFLWSHVTAALDRLRAAFELVVIEGAGSPVELNLKAADIVNMAVAQHARAPVLLVGDIDRGGVFAQLLGTLWLLSAAERTLVRGLIVNKFRGDLNLFTDGVQILEQRSAVPVLGVVPFLHDLGLPEEDAVAVETAGPASACAGDLDLAVIHLPHLANFDDFDPLRSEPGVRLRYADSPANLGQPDAIILPGTKSTVADLAWLDARGLAAVIAHRAAQGTAVVGICGGYQMLGQVIHDPEGVEASTTALAGLGLLPIETLFVAEKATHQVQVRVLGGPGWFSALREQRLTGYEIHLGRTSTATPWAEIQERSGEACQLPEGAVSASGRVWGCYLHGLFANDAFRRAWLQSLRSDFRPTAINAAARLQLGLDRLADALADAIALDPLEQIITEGVPG